MGIIVNMDKSVEIEAILVRQSHHVNANIGDEDEEVDADIKAAGAHDFLSTCHECNKQLHGKDIYMYRVHDGISSAANGIRKSNEEEDDDEKYISIRLSSGDISYDELRSSTRFAATAGFLDSGGGGEKKKKKSGNVGDEQPAVRSNITSLQIEFTMDIFGTTGIQSSFTPMMTEVTRLGSKSIAHVLNSSTGGGFNVPTYSNTFLNSTSTLVNTGPDVVGSSSATGRSLGQIPEVNAISDIGSNPNEEAPSSYANKLSHTSSTKANLCKLDANVPNDTDFDI
ncbi:zinc knuckle CX2CX4HX4C containing protein [Tanacetum coccineum]